MLIYCLILISPVRRAGTHASTLYRKMDHLLAYIKERDFCSYEGQNALIEHSYPCLELLLDTPLVIAYHYNILQPYYTNLIEC